MRDLLLAVSEQPTGDVAAAPDNIDVELFDFVIHDYDKPGEAVIDLCDGGVGQPIGDAALELRPCAIRDQLRGHMTEVTIEPAVTPDPCQDIDIVGACHPESEILRTRRHWCTLFHQ